MCEWTLNINSHLFPLIVFHIARAQHILADIHNTHIAYIEQKYLPNKLSRFFNGLGEMEREQK